MLVTTEVPELAHLASTSPDSRLSEHNLDLRGHPGYSKMQVFGLLKPTQGAESQPGAGHPTGGLLVPLAPRMWAHEASLSHAAATSGLGWRSTDVQQQERRFEELPKLRQSPLWLAASWLPFTWLRLESARLEIRWLLPSPTPTFFFFFGTQISEIKLLLESRI